MLVYLMEFFTASKEHFSRALLPLCGMRAGLRQPGRKCSAFHPALSRSVPRGTRDGAAKRWAN